MSAGIAIIAVLCVIALLPGSYDQYRKAAVQSCEDVATSLGTAELVGRADLYGQTVGGYSTRALTDALRRGASAVDSLIAEDLPDQASKSIRDQAVPLAVAAVAKVADIQSALSGNDDRRLAAEIAAANGLKGKLDAFAERYR